MVEPMFEPQEITRSLYAAVSGPAGRRRWNEAEGLFHPDARLVRTGLDSDRRTFQLVLSWPEYKNNVEGLLAGADFFEKEIDQTSWRFDQVAQIRSLYRFRLKEHAQVREGRGINLFNLVCFPHGWKIMSLIWGNEPPGFSLPVLR